MPEAPDITTAWRYLREKTPNTRQGDPLVVNAAYAQPRLRALFPFPTHGTLRFLRTAPPRQSEEIDSLPFIVCGEPPYQVYAAGYSELLGTAATPEEAAALVVAHLPEDAGSDRS
ncbi:hypothetical protein CA850_15955 [Micromonospora echinospora]|uniref:Uncharacterized protein n=1 Tax=Micromonospora echinospora TaxID=1877 RepID=A0A1C4VZA9_MICEC|nr:DUF6193 family natural product biosynthesis protein [Micromonospora echinospora]OZV80188.1 hypothetical protein CA850_15955 [Micromonospora echinospora]SCE89121.1 hypothetical protein GA0070618_1713 [Micromonospora echinospora]